MLLTYLVITTESSISHCFNYGVAQIRPLADTIFYSSKANMHIYSPTKFELFYLNYILTYEGSQKSKIASWCCKSIT